MALRVAVRPPASFSGSIRPSTSRRPRTWTLVRRPSFRSELPSGLEVALGAAYEGGQKWLEVLKRSSSRDGNGICRGLENKLEGFLCDESHVSRSRRPGVGSDGRIQALPLPERLGRREILCLVQLDVGKKGLSVETSFGLPCRLLIPTIQLL